MIENIFEITLSMSIVIIAVLLILPILEKRYSAKLRYFIWLFIAIRLIIPFNITLPKAPINIETPITNVYIGNTNSEGNSNLELNTNLETNKQNIISTNTIVSENSTNSGIQVSVLDIIKNIWILGIVIFIGYNILNYAIFRISIKKKSKETKLEVAKDVCKELSLKSIPKIVISNEVLSPMLVGFIKPLVILPEINYSDNELKVILKHEFMHYKRRDLWYKLLLIIANGMHWFNPIVYLMVSSASRDLEYSCDDEVVKNEGIEYRKDYSMTILKSMENSRATALSTYLSKNGENEKKRFKNLLDIKTKKKGLFTLLCILGLVVIMGGAITINNTKNNDNMIEFLSMEDMKKYYIDFAMDNRIDFIPNFDKNTYKENQTVSSVDFLMLTYYMNRDTLPEDSSMSAELVESVMKENFGIYNIEHKSQFKGWTYVAEENKYVPRPEGTAGDGLFDVINFNTYEEDDKKIYDVTLRTYRFPFVFGKEASESIDIYNSSVEYIKNVENPYVENVSFLLSQKGEQLKNGEINIYNAFYDLIIEDNNDGFTVGDTIRIKYYIDDATGKPRFIYKNEDPSAFIFSEKYDEVVYEKHPDGFYSIRLVQVRKGDYWGIVSGADGKEILSPDKYKLEEISINTYEEVWPIIEVKKDGLWGAIDYFGNMVIEPKWKLIWMDVYNVPDVVHVYDGEKVGGIKLTYDSRIDRDTYIGIKAGEVDYDMKLSTELTIDDFYYKLKY